MSRQDRLIAALVDLLTEEGSDGFIERCMEHIKLPWWMPRWLAQPALDAAMPEVLLVLLDIVDNEYEDVLFDEDGHVIAAEQETENA